MKIGKKKTSHESNNCKRLLASDKFHRKNEMITERLAWNFAWNSRQHASCHKWLRHLWRWVTKVKFMAKGIWRFQSTQQKVFIKFHNWNVWWRIESLSSFSVRLEWSNFISKWLFSMSLSDIALFKLLTMRWVFFVARNASLRLVKHHLVTFWFMHIE